MAGIKATKKFEKKHLKGVLERRKVTAKIKQREQIQNKKKAKRAGDNEFYKGPDANGTKPNKNIGPKAGEMSVDDFFQGGFEILEKEQKSTQKKPAAGKLGKRKRGADVEPKKDDASDSSDAQLSDDGADGSDSDSEAGVDYTEEFDTGMTKETMKALAKNDPEFYKFLKEDDPEALEFDENTNFDEIDELSGSDEEGAQPKKKQKKDKKAGQEEVDNELTQAMIAKWKASMEETHSLRAARQVVIAFRCAAHLHEGDDGTSQSKYTITNPNAFNDILKVALDQIPKVLNHHLPVKESASHKTYVNTETKKFKTLSMLVRSFATSIIHLLGTLSDDSTLKLTLSSLKPLLPYLLSFRKLLKNMVKTVVAFWSQSASTDTTRMTAFIVMDRLVEIGDKGVRDAVLKAAYQGLVQGSRVTNHNTIKGINLMKNSAASLWGRDQNLGYTTAFTFIRQLAIHLRNSIVNNKNDAFRNIYNWQYVHSLDFWSRVLSEHCSPLAEAEAGKESQLKLLIYPLVQVTLGAMRLIPTSLYFPLRFHLMRSLLRLSRATDTYIPLASALLEVLNSNEMKKPPKTSTLKQIDFEVAYKAPKSYLHTRVYQDGVGEQIVELFSEYFVLWSKNIAFPEFSLPVIIMLKRWLKDSRKRSSGNNNGKFASSLALLVQKMEMNAKFIEEKRAKVDFAPKDRKQVDAFLREMDWQNTPIGAFVVSQRILRDEKAKIMEEARQDEEQKKREEKELKGRGGDDGEDDDEGEFSDEQDVDLAGESDEEMEHEVEDEGSDEEGEEEDEEEED